MAKKLKESYLNIASVPTQVVSSCNDNPWCISDMEDNEYNIGIDQNVAPMVGDQNAEPLSTTCPSCERNDSEDINYLMQMAGIDNLAVEPEVPENLPAEVPQQEEDDVFAIEIPDDLYGDANYNMTASDYNDILANSRFPQEEPVDPFTDTDEPVDNTEVSVPVSNDPYDGLLDDETSVDAVEEPAVEEEPVQTDVENYVTEEDKPVAEEDKQPLVDYLVHNKEVIYGPNSAKVNSYRKELESKSIQELKDEASSISPNWEKYIGKYKINESKSEKMYKFDFTKILKESEEDPWYVNYIEDANAIAENFDPVVTKIDEKDASENWFSAYVVDRNSDFAAWVDVNVKDGDVIPEWNQQIFHTYDQNDAFAKACQENEVIYEMASNVAIDALQDKGLIYQSEDGTWGVVEDKVDHGYNVDDLSNLAGIKDELQEEIPEDEELLTEEGEDLSEDDLAEIASMDLEESIDDCGKKVFKFKAQPKTKAVPSELKECDCAKDGKECTCKKDGKECDCADKEISESTETEKVNNVDIEPKECDCANKKVDLNHKIPENDMIKDNIDTGDEVDYDCACKGTGNADVVYSIKKVDGMVESINSKEDLIKFMNENCDKIESIVLI